MAFGAYSEGWVNNTAASCTVSHTVSGSDKALYVLVMNSNSTDLLAAGTCTFNGSSLGSPIATQAGGSNHRLYAWRMTAPPSGTFDAVVTASASAQLHVHVFSLTGVDQTTPNGTIASSGSSSQTSPISNSVTLSTDGMAIDLCSRRSAGITLTPGGGQTAGASTLNSSGTAASSRGSYKAGSGSTSMSWAFSSTSDVIHIVIPVNAASGATPVTFSGTIPTLTYSDGETVDEDLSSYFSGTETPFSYADIGADFSALGLTLNTSTGHITGTAVEGSVSGCQIEAEDQDTATDQSNTFTITVTAANAAPVWDTAPSDMTTKRGQALTPQDLSALVSDADMDTLSFACSGLPTGATCNSSTGMVSGTPTAAPGVYTVTPSIDDGVNSPVNGTTFDITVQQCVLDISGTQYQVGDGNDPSTMVVADGYTWIVNVHDYTATDLDDASQIYSATGVTANSSGTVPNPAHDDLSYGEWYLLTIRKSTGHLCLNAAIQAS